MLSFIIPAHNEAVLIRETLDALLRAARALGDAFEVIVVDDASDDGTTAVAAASGATVLQVTHRHIAATRNAGARASRGDVLIFVDADTQIDAALLRAATAALQQGVIGGGAAVELLGPVSRHQRWLARVIVRGLHRAGIAPGCFLFCTRAAFEAVGGFDESYFAGEDVALSRALARHGRFVLLREPARTSARKLHTFSLREQLAPLLQFLRHGRRMLRSRDALPLWYGARRHAPDAPRAGTDASADTTRDASDSASHDAGHEAGCDTGCDTRCDASHAADATVAPSTRRCVSGALPADADSLTTKD